MKSFDFGARGRMLARVARKHVTDQGEPARPTVTCSVRSARISSTAVRL